MHTFHIRSFQWHSTLKWVGGGLQPDKQSSGRPGLSQRASPSSSGPIICPAEAPGAHKFMKLPELSHTPRPQVTQSTSLWKQEVKMGVCVQETPKTQTQ